MWLQEKQIRAGSHCELGHHWASMNTYSVSSCPSVCCHLPPPPPWEAQHLHRVQHRRKGYEGSLGSSVLCPNLEIPVEEELRVA